MTGIGENTLAQPVKPPLRERCACLAKLVKNRLTLTTKAGNALARTALIESAWHYSACSPKPKAPAPGTDVPPAIRSRADDCTARLHRRREALADAGKPACRANAAVARELACWVWEIGRRAEGTLG